MASSRKLPTVYNVSTYGAAGFGRDYTSLSAWESATDNDLVTAASGEILTCYNDATSYEDYVTIEGATTDQNYFRVINVAQNNMHDGTPNKGVHIANTTDQYCIWVKEDYCQIHDLVLSSILSHASDVHTLYLRDGTGMAGVGCISIDSNNTGAGDAHAFYSGDPASTGTHYFVNCIAIGTKMHGFNHWDGTCYYMNCTAYNNARGFGQDGGTVYAKNTIADSNTTADYTGTITQTTTLDSTDSVSFQATGSDDVSLATGDTAARENGTDLSADGAYAFDDDIINHVRPKGSLWDIGAWEGRNAWSNKVNGIINPVSVGGVDYENIEKVNNV